MVATLVATAFGLFRLASHLGAGLLVLDLSCCRDREGGGGEGEREGKREGERERQRPPPPGV